MDRYTKKKKKTCDRRNSVIFFDFFFRRTSETDFIHCRLADIRRPSARGSGAKFSRTVQMCSSGHRTRLRGPGSPAGYYIIQSWQSIYKLHVWYTLHRNIEIPSTSLPSRGDPGVRYRPLCRRRHPSCRPFRWTGPRSYILCTRREGWVIKYISL